MKCTRCQNEALAPYQNCQIHINLNRQHYYNVKASKGAEGKCWYCHRKAQNGGIRCKTHRAINKDRCSEWNRRNPGRNRLNQIKFTAATGRCYKCREHNPVRPGKLTCTFCVNRYARHS